ncbi:MAG: M20/M25/M40 family metallo-hydrolase [Nitrospinota bacterium]
MSAVLEKVISQVRRIDVVTLLQELIQIPSPTGEEGAVQALVQKRFADAGLEVEAFEANLEELREHPAFSAPRFSLEKGYAGRPNVLGRMRGAGGGRSLLLFCHADTVPPGPRNAWTRDPLGGEIENNRIYGRGAGDAKSGLAIMIACAHAIKGAGVRLRGDLTLLSTIEEEEGGGGGMLACVLRGLNADGAVYTHMKPGGFGGVDVGSGGDVSFRITVPGQAGHKGSSHLFVNAIEKAEKIHAALRELDAQRGAMVREPLVEKRFELSGLQPRTVNLVVTMIRAGVSIGQLPAECVLEGVAGVAPRESLEEVQKLVENHVARTAEADPWLREHPPRLEWTERRAHPCLTDSEHPFVRTALSVAERVTGRPSQLQALNGTTDMRFPILYGDTPTIMFGGNCPRGHIPDEFTHLDELQLSVDALLNLVLEWCGVA